MSQGEAVRTKPTLAEVFGVLAKSSEAFEQSFVKFPTTHNRIAHVARHGHREDLIARCAQQTRIIAHQRIVPLIEGFLAFKKAHGTAVEKKIYEHMSVRGFVYRCISKRPLCFLDPSDHTVLINGKQPDPKDWSLVGTEEERSSAIKMRDYLTYDEMQLSALLAVSSPTPFINNGEKTNHGRPMNRGTYEEYGILSGIVGTRFERDDVMESQHILVTSLNEEKRGFGKAQMKVNDSLKALWADFYRPLPSSESSEYFFPTLEELTSLQSQGKLSTEYIPHKTGHFFNVKLYKFRIRLSLEAFLLDCEQRGIEASKSVYVRLRGVGLGVWRVRDDQLIYFLETIGDILNEAELPHIADLVLDYSPEKKLLGVGHDELFTSKNGVNKVTLHFQKENIADKLSATHQDKLLCTNFPWDSNAFPGNEYWMGALAASGDPAAASCSCIPELQNVYINPYINENSIRFYGS